MVLKTLNLEGPQVEPEELVGDPHHLAPLLRGVFRYTRPDRVLDATAGSKVTARVANEFGVPVIASDLNDAERPVDLFKLREGGFDLVVFHPDLWESRRDAEHGNDLGGPMPWEVYVEKCADAVEHLASLLTPQGSLLLVAPIARRAGVVYSLARELTDLLGAASDPEMVHPHPECRSRGTMFGKRFIPIAHDQVILWRRAELLDEEPQAANAAQGVEASAADEAHEAGTYGGVDTDVAAAVSAPTAQTASQAGA